MSFCLVDDLVEFRFFLELAGSVPFFFFRLAGDGVSDDGGSVFRLSDLSDLDLSDFSDILRLAFFFGDSLFLRATGETASCFPLLWLRECEDTVRDDSCGRSGAAEGGCDWEWDSTG